MPGGRLLDPGVRLDLFGFPETPAVRFRRRRSRTGDQIDYAREASWSMPPSQSGRRLSSGGERYRSRPT